MITRRATKEVTIGNLVLGGAHPVTIQTMYADSLPPLSDESSFEQILHNLRSYKTMGCAIVRFSYPSLRDHETLLALANASPMPVVADIHFDWRLALDAFTCGVAKVRINPGNIGARWKVEEIVRAAQDCNGAIRIGLNGGSLPKARRDEDRSLVMVETALEYLEWFEKLGFTNTVISLKDSDGEVTYQANRTLAAQCDTPIHLGVTEAGGVVSAVTRSTWVLGRLLSEGIGDTLRISITDDPLYEIEAGRELLRSVGLEEGGIRVVSCPRCGRNTFDSQAFLQRVQRQLLALPIDATVAIMGCQVNGPGEAARADVAITGIGNKVFLYRKGLLVREVSVEEAENALFAELEKFSHE